MLARIGKTGFWTLDVSLDGLGSVILDCHDSTEGLSDVWRTLQAQGTSSAYQRLEWVSGWVDLLASTHGLTPRIVVGRDATGVPLFLFPLGHRVSGGIRRLEWLADSHSNFHMGLFSAACLKKLTDDTFRILIKTITDRMGDVDVLHLSCQPADWAGWQNPFAGLASYPSSNPAFALDLHGGFEAALKRINGSKRRKKFRWQMNQIGGRERVRLIRATDPTQIDRVLTTAFAQIADRFADMGVRNVFQDESVRRFFVDLALSSREEGEPAFTSYALEIDGKIRATLFGGSSCGYFSASFISFADDEFTRISPGELLNYLIMEDCASRGIAQFDFGRGHERYKLSWCDTTIEMFDTVLPLTHRGHAYAAVARTVTSAKRAVRNNAQVWAIAKRIRKRLNRT